MTMTGSNAFASCTRRFRIAPAAAAVAAATLMATAPDPALGFSSSRGSAHRPSHRGSIGDIFDSSAFATPTFRRGFGSPILRMSSSDDATSNPEVAALLAAAAKARAEADRLRQELGQAGPNGVTVSATATASVEANTKKSAEEISKLVPALVSRGYSATEDWSALQRQSKAFGSANLRTYPVSLQMLEQRGSGLTASSLGLDDSNVNLDDFKYATLFVTLGSAVVGVAALALLPPNVGATVCYLVALLPVLFLAVGSTAPQVIANAIAGLRGESSDGNGPSRKERICRHEAAHLCCGYWCGLAITAYATSDPGNPRVEFGVAPSEPRGYSATQVAALAVTSLGGSVGEALAYGRASGAAQDLQALQSVFRRAADFYGANSQQDVTRWAALQASQLLRQNADKYEKVVKAIERQASIEECVQILEE